MTKSTGKGRGGARPNAGRLPQSATLRPDAPVRLTMLDNGGIVNYGAGVVKEIRRSGASRIVCIRLATGEELRLMIV